MKLGLWLWALTLISSLINASLGLWLSQVDRINAEISLDEIHLVCGFATTALLLMALFTVLTASKRTLELMAAAQVPKVHSFAQERERHLLPSFFSVGLCLMGLITGTLSDGGTFPLIHGAMGLGLILAVALCLFRWRRLARWAADV